MLQLIPFLLETFGALNTFIKESYFYFYPNHLNWILNKILKIILHVQVMSKIITTNITKYKHKCSISCLWFIILDCCIGIGHPSITSGYAPDTFAMTDVQYYAHCNYVLWYLLDNNTNFLVYYYLMQAIVLMRGVGRSWLEFSPHNSAVGNEKIYTQNVVIELMEHKNLVSWIIPTSFYTCLKTNCTLLYIYTMI